MKNNSFQEFIWERDGNGDYPVTDKKTGMSVTAIRRLGKPVRYCIRESEEREINFYGQSVPKTYNKFGVMAFCRSRSTPENFDTATREGLPDA